MSNSETQSGGVGTHVPVGIVQENIVSKLSRKEVSPIDAISEFDKYAVVRKYVTQGLEARLAQYQKYRKQRDRVHQNRIPFITKDFLPDFYMCQGAILVGAESGRGKTSIACNIVAGIVKEMPLPKVLYLTNEENPDALYERIAASIAELPFKRVHYRELNSHEERSFEKVLYDVVFPSVEIVCEGDFEMHFIEDVQAVMENAGKEHYTAVVLDYHQNVNASRENAQLESWTVSKRLGEYYRDFGKRFGVPVFVLCQLSAKSDGGKFKDRVENDKTLFNHSFIAIEAVPDFQTRTTKFIVQKDRYNSCTGKEVVMQFLGGRYEGVVGSAVNEEGKNRSQEKNDEGERGEVQF